MIKVLNDNNIFIMGDIHGDYLPIQNFMFNKNLNKNTILIILGDFSSNYYLNKKDLIFKEKLEKYNITYFIIRGNHEYRPSECAAGIIKNKNKTTWKNKIFFDNDVLYEEEFPSILYAKDGPAIYNINGHKTLVLPGAYSVDKYYRLEKNFMWNQTEQPNKEEMEEGLKIAAKNAPFDLILSHTCPDAWMPRDLFLKGIDQKMVDRTTEYWLQEIECFTKYKAWCFGHFHDFRKYSKIFSSCNGQPIMFFNNALSLNQIFHLAENSESF